ncbi:MAG: hypothetical protein EOO28_36535 [Comamonadaceae bacterium]|nr:MAG: hypothetical protein EOO28_36535 [Comamonadaceae bacterium]
MPESPLLRGTLSAAMFSPSLALASHAGQNALAAQVELPLPRRASDADRAHHGDQGRQAASYTSIVQALLTFPAGAADADVLQAAREICEQVKALTNPDAEKMYDQKLELFGCLDDILSKLNSEDMDIAVLQEEVADLSDQSLVLRRRFSGERDIATQVQREVDARTWERPAAVRGLGGDAHPPVLAQVKTEQVQAALGRLVPHLPHLPHLAADVAARAPVLQAAAGDLYEVRPTRVADTRFATGVELKPRGRELLRHYFNRKYHTDIVFTGGSIEAATAGVADFIQGARRDAPHAGADMRRAQFMGHAGGHGSVLLYLREHGEEALLLFDPAGGAGDIKYGSALALACASLGPGGAPVKVYQHAQALQRDFMSCWAFSMKAAVMMTGRQPDGHGGFGGYLLPGAIEKLEARRLQTAPPSGVRPVWALPELSRTSQYIHIALQNVGTELDGTVEDGAQDSVTRNFVERFTYQRGDDSLTVDYMRQKGERLAELVEIEAWSQEVGKIAGPDIWTAQRQTAFAEDLKQMMRRPPAALPQA